MASKRRRGRRPDDLTFDKLVRPQTGGKSVGVLGPGAIGGPAVPGVKMGGGIAPASGGGGGGGGGTTTFTTSTAVAPTTRSAGTGGTFIIGPAPKVEKLGAPIGSTSQMMMGR